MTLNQEEKVKLNEINRKPQDGEDLESYIESLGPNKKQYIQVLKKNEKLREELKIITEATENLLQQEKEKKRIAK